MRHIVSCSKCYGVFPAKQTTVVENRRYCDTCKKQMRHQRYTDGNRKEMKP